MTTFFKTLFLAFALAVASAFEKAGEVLVLTDADIDEAIQAHEFLLIEFYAPWCGHCKRLDPEYTKAAEQLAGIDKRIALAKVDSTEEKEASSRFGVRGYPTLKWFVNGKDSEYNGGRTASEIVGWIKKKTGAPCKTLSSGADLDTFKDGAEVVAVGFFGADSEEFKAFEGAARVSEGIEYAFSTDSDLAAAHGVSIPSVVVYKKFDEGKAVYSGDFEASAIQAFVAGNAVPLISTFSQESASKIFGSGIDTHLLYFNDASDSSHETILAQLREVAPEFRGKTLFVFVPASEDRVMSYFDFKANDLPKAILVALGSGDMKKFGFNKEITAENVRAHVGAYHSGELKPTLKSEEIPADNSAPVTVLVGKNFNDIVLDTTKDVLVEFYAPWCGHCKSLAPVYDQLGAKFADIDSIVIAKVDATANDIEHPAVHVEGFPTLIFFPANNKASPMKYEGGRDLESMVEYVQTHATTLSGAGEADADKHAHIEL
eukprot:c14832_g1_i1.p1 GENE.c14832_g1_i1~~c14832_g1_i1.p1  ORF type:complete len:504 (+),score=126.24 c14832_g1_i1:50-1513(+)